MYWASSCGGCEIALVNINEKILEVIDKFDFMFCPCLLDTKKKDIKALPDKSIEITLFNGAVRTEENAEMANLLRKKSKILIAFGSCSNDGCIPGLSNLYSAKDHFDTIYLNNPTVSNPGGIVPQRETEMPEGTLHLPEFYDTVKTLSQVVDVDYFIPGCPPESNQIWDVINSVIEGVKLPPKGSVIGAGTSTVCDECEKIKEDKKIDRFYRTYEIIPDVKKCLLEQGIICMGIATRAGCGSLCPKVNMPCSGCYGAPDGVLDQGAKMIAALGSILNLEGDLTEEEITGHTNKIIDSIPDYAGTFYKFSLAGSILKNSVRK